MKTSFRTQCIDTKDRNDEQQRTNQKNKDFFLLN